MGPSSAGETEKHTNTVDIESATVDVADLGFWAKARTWAGAMGAEEHGVERIPEDLRTNQPPSDLCTLFIANNCNITTLATGYLATTTYGLGWWDAFLVIIFFNVLTGVVPAIAASFGPKLGLRTMVIARYSFGYEPAKVLAVLNIINQLGWGAVSAITAGEILYDVGGDGLPDTAAVLVVCIVAVAFGLLGYRVLHAFDRYSWLVMLVCFVLLAGFGAPHFVNVPLGTGASERSNVFAMATAIVGYQVAWLPVAADYGVYMRETVGAQRSFWWALLGLLTSQILIELLGAAVGTLASNPGPVFAEASGIGGMMGAVFEGHGMGVRGFGKFIEILLAFSASAVLTTNIYSLGLSVQILSARLLVVPRFVWSLLGGAALMACSIAGRDSLAEVMTNFLSMCAYWIMPFCTVMLEEHFLWRRRFEYDLAAWNDPKMLPCGIAASVAFVVGTLLSVLCMNQVWWVGPIALAIGPEPSGTDVSWILAFVASSAIFIPLRSWERKRFGR